MASASCVRLTMIVAAVVVVCAPLRASPDIPWETIAAEARRPGRMAEGLLQKAAATPADLVETTFAVLVPDDETFLRGMRIVAKSHIYTASSRLPRHRVSVFGVRTAQQAVDDATSTSERKAVVSFARWGASYRITIECLEGEPGWCIDPTRIKTMSRALILLNRPPAR